VAVPQVKRVHPVLDEEVKILKPEGLVVEPWKQLRRVWVLIDSTARQDVGLLHPDTGAAKSIRGGISNVQFGREFAGLADPVRKLQASV